MKCASAGSSVVFMPRIDLWAVETHYDVASEVDTSKKMETEFPEQQGLSEEMAGPKGLQQSSSQAWNSFIEQAESVCVNTSLVVVVRLDYLSIH